MNYEIVEMYELSGNAAKVYSIIPEGEDETLFERFVEEYRKEFRVEIEDIVKRLYQVGHTTGARDSFFKPEGDRDFVNKYGKYICALYDEDERNLRLYCIRFSSVAIILGGGGYKDKSIKKWQEDKGLSEEVRKIMTYAKIIIVQLDSGDLFWSGNELTGNLKNYSDE